MNITYLWILQKLREMSGGIFDGFMCQITVLAEGTVTFLVMAAIYWCIHKRTGQLMGCNVALACTLNQFLKAVCKVERPWVRDGRIHPVEAAVPAASGYSFPSGHTARAVAVWGSAGWSAWKGENAASDKLNQKKTYRGVSIFIWFLTFLIMFSRNYLGVHTSWDVLGAFVIGLLFIWSLDRILDWVEKGKNRDFFVCLLGCILCFLPMLRVGCISNAGAGMGLLIGWLVERRWIGFSVDGTPGVKIIRFGVGAILLVGIQKVLPSFLSLFMLPKYAGFFASFTLAVFIMAVYPFIFSILEQKQSRKLTEGLIAVLVLLLLVIFFIAVLRVRAIKIQTENAAEQEAVTEELSGETEDLPPAGTEDTAADLTDPEVWRTENAGGLAMPKQGDANADFISAEEETVPLLIAHRGYSSEFPENTLPAFEGALDLGVDYIETDVQMTKDGELVLFHDDELFRITGAEGVIMDYTYDELSRMDAGVWFGSEYEGVRIPKLDELLKLLQESDCRLYLELKDIGDVEGFEEAVLAEVEMHGLLDRCVFASFQYNYLVHLKELNPDVKVLFNTSSADLSLPEEYPAEYYGLNKEAATEEVIRAIHDAGSQAYVWTVNTPGELLTAKAAGIDGIVTNCPGLMKVIRYQAYQYLAENYTGSVTLPGLYEPELPEGCDNMVVQGLTRTDDNLVVSAYSKSGENSILYITDLEGHLQNILDTGTKAHMGGIAYDASHDLLWMTGEEGRVWAAPWTAMLDGSWNGEGVVSFDAGLVNHNQSKVASFLCINGNRLYVGSYVDGASGTLNCYDITDSVSPQLISSVTIPERIQGITFQTKTDTGIQYMILSQGYQMEDAYLLKYEYQEETMVYAEPLYRHTLPEGAEQVLTTPEGLYILFESAARPYRATSRIVNDQIYIIHLNDE